MRSIARKIRLFIIMATPEHRYSASCAVMGLTALLHGNINAGAMFWIAGMYFEDKAMNGNER